MPLHFDTPEQTVTTDDRARVESYSVLGINTPTGLAVSVQLSRGSGDPYVERAGSRSSASLQTATIAGKMSMTLADILTEMGLTADQVTYYDATKHVLYSALVADGCLGAGTVE